MINRSMFCSRGCFSLLYGFAFMGPHYSMCREKQICAV